MSDTRTSGFDFTHTRLLVPNYRECFRFYRDVLGFDVGFGDEDEGYADFRTGETTLALFEQDAMADAVGTDDRPSNATGQDTVALTFRVENVDEAFDRVTDVATGVTEPHDRPEWGIRVAHVRDPAGTLLEINQPLDDA